MIGIGFKKGKKITLEASFQDSEFEAAEAVAAGLARHNRHEIVVYLYHKSKNKVKILRRVKAVRAGFLWLGKKVIAQ